MAKHNHETLGLLFLASLCGLATGVSYWMGHERRLFLLILTILMGMLTYLAQLRYRRSIRTLKGRGHRKQKPSS